MFLTNRADGDRVYEIPTTLLQMQRLKSIQYSPRMTFVNLNPHLQAPALDDLAQLRQTSDIQPPDLCTQSRTDRPVARAFPITFLVYPSVKHRFFQDIFF